MLRARWTFGLAALALGGGCEGCAAEPHGTPPADTQAPDDTGADDDSGALLPGGPCGDGSWAGWTDPEGLVHVAEGSEEGDGSAEAPFGTLAEALAATRGDGGELRIALWPGVYWGAQLKRPGAGDARLTLSGCGRGETILRGHEVRHAILEIEGPSPVTVRWFFIDSGRGRALEIRNRAQATVEDIEVAGSDGRGISVTGPATTAVLRGVYVHDVTGTYFEGPRGWGVTSSGAALTLEDVRIEAVRGFGLFGQYGTVVASGLEVVEVGKGVASGGFGVFLRNMALASIEDCAVSETHGAGIYLLDVQLGEVARCAVSGVRRDAQGSAEGILLRRAFRSEHRGTQRAWLLDNTVVDVDRMGIASWGVQVHLDGNVVSSASYEQDGVSIFVDPDALVTGSDEYRLLDRRATPIGPPAHDGHGGPQPGGRRYQDPE